MLYSVCYTLIIWSVCFYFFSQFCVMFFFFKQKTAYEMRISDWSSDVCSSDLGLGVEIVDVAGNIEDVSARVAQQARSFTGLVASAGEEIGRASCRERVCQYV